MNIKRITAEQVALLRKGDIIKRYTSKNNTEEILDGRGPKNMTDFEIRSINRESEMVGLVMTEASQDMFTWPGDVERLFIKSYNLVAEKVWWVNSTT